MVTLTPINTVTTITISKQQTKNKMTTTIDTEVLLKNTCALTLTVRCWGNRRQGNMNNVETTADKSRLRLTKDLIVSEDYDKIQSFLNETKGWILARTMPFLGFKRGIYLAKLETVAAIEEEMPKRIATLDKKVRRLIDVYEEKIEEAKKKLGVMFELGDYPSIQRLPSFFGFDWNWIAFVVPENLPKELRKTEQAKLQKKFKDAGDEIIAALRAGFGELIDHAIDRLTPGEDQKEKIFRDTTITNINAFIETFSARNLMNDKDLESLVARAKDIVDKVNPETLRASKKFRVETVKAFSVIKDQVDKMITEKPSRKFDLD